MFQPVSKIVPKSSTGVTYAIAIGRISTIHQDMASVDAAYEADLRVLQAVAPGEINIHRCADRASGWVVRRKSMRVVEDLIRSGHIDVVVMQDLGRAFRNPAYQLRLAQMCKDHRTRLICPGDALDTSSENWEINLQSAALRHGIMVPETRRRVRTKATYDFHNGGMVIKVPAFYRKLTKEEAESNDGVRIARIPDYDAIMREIRTRIVELGHSGEQVATWLRKERIPTGPYAKNGWTGQLVRSVLRNPILYGRRTFRRVKHEIIYETGDHRRELNPTPEVEDVPSLAFMTFEEWMDLQEALDRLGDRGRAPHPGRKNVGRRQTYFPGQHLVCSCCGQFMYWCGRDLKCQNAYPGRPQSCWNRLLVDGELLRQRLLPMLLGEVRKRPACYESLLEAVWTTFERALNEKDAEELHREHDLNNLEGWIRQVTALLRKAPESESLLNELVTAEAKLRALRAETPSHDARIPQETKFVSRESVAEDLEEALLYLSRTSYDLGTLLRENLPDLKVVPVMAVGSEQIRPRIKWHLPADPDSGEPAVELVLDAFEYSLPIRYARDCERLKGEHPDWSLNRIGQELGITKKSAGEALKYAAVLREHGVEDPFVEVTERPAKAARWRLQSEKEDVAGSLSSESEE